MNTGRVPPLVWHSNTWMMHWVHGVLDQQERPPDTTVTQPTLKQPWVVWSDSSTTYRTQTTTDPHSWGWTELGQTQPKTPHCGVHQLQAVLVAVLTDLLFMLWSSTYVYTIYTAILLTYCQESFNLFSKMTENSCTNQKPSFMQVMSSVTNLQTEGSIQQTTVMHSQSAQLNLTGLQLPLVSF